MLQPLSIRARPAALLLTIGALSVGLSACGSSSSTGTHRSTSPKVKKEAVVLGKDVQFTVTNEPSTGGSLRVSVCDATSEGSSADVAVRVAITWDATSGMGIVYVDGVNKKQTTYRGAIGVSTMPLFIGTKHDNDKVTNWDGDLDEIVLYNRALTAAEVQQLAAP